MAGKQNLIRRGVIWYYQRRPPLHVVSLYGRLTLKRSLQTTDLHVAKKLRTSCDLEFDALVARLEARRADNASSTTPLPGITSAELVACVQELA